MKRFLSCLSLSLAVAASGAAFAGELEDANALFEKKDYAGALKIYTKLANAGNPHAQQQLGQMYWYGEAGAVDEAKAKGLFEQAAAKGNKVAADSLVIMQQRVERRAEIDYWIKGYDGADLQSGEYRCPSPRIPAVSKLNDEIERVNKLVTNWQDCYNKMVTNLNAQSPLTKRIPPDIAKLMNKQETEASTAYLEQVRQNIAEGAKVNSKMILADFAAWRSATEAFVDQHNSVVNKAKN
ncbi:tetratricopeptide repeat protein [Massilia sp. HP4]|uniref:tetratricopeptide repeat protein n=1 Tax=Massilia sp. HP4 TaxID=2562316 RepID=UPI0010C09916|nr:sel1 repeat family protein [Massilia sp. HP4]